MFDATIETGSEWQQTVKDAVLEKSSPATIVHVAVDSSSSEGCVYVRWLTIYVCVRTQNFVIVYLLSFFCNSFLDSRTGPHSPVATSDVVVVLVAIKSP